MGTLLIDKDELLAHAADDGNPLTEIAGAVMQKKLYSDVLQDAIDAAHLTVGLVFGTEGGTAVESGGLLSLAATGSAHAKGVYTAALFTDIDVEADFTNFAIVDGDDERGGVGILLVYDVNNYVYCRRYTRPESGTNKMRFTVVQGGVTRVSTDVIQAATSYSLAIVRSGNTYTGYYDIGAGRVQIDTVATGDIGTARVSLHATVNTDSGITTTSADINNLVITGSGIYWDTLSDSSAIRTTYNEQTVAEGAGAIIQYGSASFGEGSNMKYRVKAGTGKWSSFLNAAGIQAFGDVVTDNGKFDIEAQYEGATALASWETVKIPTISGALLISPWGSLAKPMARQIA